MTTESHTLYESELAELEKNATNIALAIGRLRSSDPVERAGAIGVIRALNFANGSIFSAARAVSASSLEYLASLNSNAK